MKSEQSNFPINVHWFDQFQNRVPWCADHKLGSYSLQICEKNYVIFKTLKQTSL